MVNHGLVMASETRQDVVLQAIGKLQRLTDLFQRRRAELARRVGLTEQQWRVLEEISREHFIPSMFAREKESSAAAVSKVLRQLLDKELVAVSISPTDGRQRDYELTPGGKRVMGRLRRLRQQAIDSIWTDFDAAALARFNDFADQLSARIEAYAGADPGAERSAK